MQAIQSPQAMASQINALLCLSEPVPGTAANGWFGEDALQYLRDLARTNELPAVRVIAYAARHELVD